MSEAINVLVPPYKDVITLNYTTSAGKCVKAADDKASDNKSASDLPTTLEECKARCDNNAPFCLAYSWQPEASKDKCILYNEKEALKGDGTSGITCYHRTTNLNHCEDYKTPSSDK